MRVPVPFRLLACLLALAIPLSAAADGPGQKRPHHHHRNPGSGALLLAVPLLLFGAPAPDYPGYIPRTYPDFGPVLYLERYDGPPPDAATSDWLYCPAADDSWPQVRACPDGWARVIEHPENPAAAGN